MKTVRDGRKVWPYCSECGCRLYIAVGYKIYPTIHPLDDVFLWHFGNEFSDRDARGCLCSLKYDEYVLHYSKVVQFVGE